MGFQCICKAATGEGAPHTLETEIRQLCEEAAQLPQ
jgi:hypothetical protein